MRTSWRIVRYQLFLQKRFDTMEFNRRSKKSVEKYYIVFLFSPSMEGDFVFSRKALIYDRQELRRMFKEKEIRKYLIFSGRVQGVGFRYRAMNIAQMLGLTGWVKNRWDGKVEMEVQGKREEIGKMISMLYQQRFIWIEDIEEKEIPVEKESSFSIH